MWDFNKLRGRMVEKGLSFEKAAECLDMSYTSFSLKMNNHREFTASDIDKLRQELEILPENVSEYFFTHKV